ncbi:MAG: hypothetical protein NVSMB4_00750 [Acidimicrobiales bacterium]
MSPARPPVGRGPGRPRHETPSPEYLKRRAEIVETAARIFQARGYEAGSLDDVASELGLRKASLYYYVRSKAELLYLVFDQAISRALENIENLLISTDSPRERLERVIRHQILIVAADPSLFTVFFDQRPHLDADSETKIRAKERRYVRLFAEAVETAAASGVIDADDPRVAAQLLVGMTSWTYKWFDAAIDDPQAVASAAVRLILGDGPSRR